MISSKYLHHYPHNVLKYCPKCGAEGLSPQITKTFLADVNPSNNLICSRCNFELFINTATAVATIIHVSEETLLLGRRKQEPGINTLDLPGGFVNTRETAEDAVQREIHEEFNLRLSNLTLFNKTYWNEYDFGGLVTFTIDLIFICEIEDWSKFNLNEPEEVTREDILIKDINIEDFGLPSIKQAIREYKDGFLQSR